jgi:hypothetical protein
VLNNESYLEIQDMPKEYKNLRLAILENDKEKASKLVETFFTKDWVARAKKEGGKNVFNDYDNPNNSYAGHWNFAVAAFSLLLNIDVSSFYENEFFPKDLYDYAKYTK